MHGLHYSMHNMHMFVHDAGQQARGATAYVTLEPCNHYGKTPPCSQALVDAQVAKVSLEALLAISCSASCVLIHVPSSPPPPPPHPLPLGALLLQAAHIVGIE